MGAIEVEPGLSVRFPGRSDDFAEGVEVGILSILMAQGMPDITREIPIPASIRFPSLRLSWAICCARKTGRWPHARSHFVHVAAASPMVVSSR